MSLNTVRRWRAPIYMTICVVVATALQLSFPKGF